MSEEVYLRNGQKAVLLYEVPPAGYVVCLEAITETGNAEDVYQLVDHVLSYNPIKTPEQERQEDEDYLKRISEEMENERNKLKFYSDAVRTIMAIETLAELQNQIKQHEHEIRLIPIKMRVAKQRAEKEMGNAK